MVGLTAFRNIEVELEKLRFAVRQARKSSVGGFIAAPVLTLYLSRDLSPVFPMVWLFLIMLALALRNHWLARAEQALKKQDAPYAGRVIQYSSLALALVIALLPVWALPRLPLGHGFFFTTIVCLWVSVGMISLGVFPRLFTAYACLIVIGLAIGWIQSSSDFALAIILLLLMYALILRTFCQGFARIVETGIRIRLENQELVKELTLANETKIRFILAASHDLKQPLQALTLFSHALRHSQDGQEMKQVASGIQQSVQALGQLFAAVLDLSKIDAKAITPMLQPLYLPELMNRLAREYDFLCHEKNLAWKMQQLPVTLNTDPALLERLLRNLLDNAIKHGARGPIEVGMSLGTELVITVSDHGPGIPLTEREHVFKEFYRLTSAATVGGLGLGLSIVQRLAHLLGYRLDIAYTDPLHNTGTQFRIMIPPASLLKESAAQDTFENARENAAAADVNLTGLSVLVIDDDPSVLQATLVLLRQWGCHAMGAAHVDALPQGLAFQPDVAFVDNNQSAKGNALLMADAVLARWPEAGIILVTGESNPAVLSQLRDGGYPLLEKPVAPEKLRQVLELFHHMD